MQKVTSSFIPTNSKENLCSLLLCSGSNYKVGSHPLVLISTPEILLATVAHFASIVCMQLLRVSHGTLLTLIKADPDRIYRSRFIPLHKLHEGANRDRKCSCDTMQYYCPNKRGIKQCNLIEKTCMKTEVRAVQDIHLKCWNKN